MKVRLLAPLCGFALAAASANAQLVFEIAPEQSGATRVLAWVNGPDLVLVNPRTGEETTPPDVADIRTSNEGLLRWEVISDSTDALGMRHVHYRQRFRPRHGAATLPAGLAVSGVPVHGSHLGFHYDPEGRLQAVGASRYEDVSWIGGIALTSVDAAQNMAAWALANHAGIQVGDLGMLPDGVAARLRADTRLDLVPRGDGRSFEFVWTVPVAGAEGLGYTARIHAQTGDLLGHSEDVVPYSKKAPPIPSSEGPSCTPAALTGSEAIAYAQNTSIGQDGLRPSDELTQASPSVTLADFYYDYDPDIRYQAAEKFGSTEIVVYSGLGNQTTQCRPDGLAAKRLRLVPLEGVAPGSPPIYDDLFDLDQGYDLPGRAAGDAFRNVHLTLSGFAGLASRANVTWVPWTRVTVVVNSDLHNPSVFFDFAEFARSDSVWGYEKTLHFHSVTEYPDDPDDGDLVPDAVRFPASASLDVTAHELGHRLIFDSTGWPYDPIFPFLQQMHEGWADALGHMVEHMKHNEDSCTNGRYECPDWTAGEDHYQGNTGGYSYTDPNNIFHDNGWDRSVDASFDDLQGFSLHNQDPGDDTSPYGMGVRIPLALRLSIEGGFNQVCDRDEAQQEEWVGCHMQPSPGESVDGRPFNEMSGLFFRLLTVYGTHISTWQDLADWAKLAGYDLFHDNPGWPQQCDDGILQQRAAYEAFRAIGFPGYSTGYVCSCVESCEYQ